VFVVSDLVEFATTPQKKLISSVLVSLPESSLAMPKEACPHGRGGVGERQDRSGSEAQ
jgi:hypothetical protein